MKLMLILATTFALTRLANSQQVYDYQGPDKTQAILAIEQHLSARFVKEGLSNDGRSVKWEFVLPPYHGIPLVIDLTAFPTLEQMDAASIAAFSEAETVYGWLNDEGHKKTATEPSPEPTASPPAYTVDEYLERMKHPSPSPSPRDETIQEYFDRMKKGNGPEGNFIASTLTAAADLATAVIGDHHSLILPNDGWRGPFLFPL
jgi:hypothetical protein